MHKSVQPHSPKNKQQRRPIGGSPSTARELAKRFLAASDVVKYPVVKEEFYGFYIQARALATFLLSSIDNYCAFTGDDLSAEEREARLGILLFQITKHIEKEVPRFVTTLVTDGILSTLSKDDGFISDFWESHPRPNRLMRSRYAADTLSDGSKDAIDGLLKQIGRQAKRRRNLDRSGPVRGKIYKKRFRGDPQLLHELVSEIRTSLSRILTDRDACRPENAEVLFGIERAYKETYGESAETLLEGICRQKDLTDLACEIVMRRNPKLDKRKVRRHYLAYEAQLTQ